MKLLPNYVAHAQGPKESVTGTWSTIYDQAMRVELDNGTRFITNFRYNIKPDISADPYQDGSGRFEGTQTGDYQSFDSVCHETMVGFVQKVHGQGSMQDHKAQCFFAKQRKHLPAVLSERTENSDGVKMDKIVKVDSHA